MPMKERINQCKTLQELDALRLDILKDKENFSEHQKLFIKVKNRIKRSLTFKGRAKAKEKSTSELVYPSTCIRCDRYFEDISKETDYCWGCELYFLEQEEQLNIKPKIETKEEEFQHYKKVHGWDDSKDEEIWNEYFKF